jgi:hypothetical protein
MYILPRIDFVSPGFNPPILKSLCKQAITPCLPPVNREQILFTAKFEG